MNARNMIGYAKRLAIPALGAAGLTLVSASAIAEDMQEILVVAPHIVTRKEVGRTYTGRPIEDVAVSHWVTYADLDLTKDADVATLETRVKDVAQHSCTELQQIAPVLDQPPSVTNKECYRLAMDEAMPQVTAAVAAAKK